MESKENKEQIEEKFQAKLQGLLEMAKKKKMVIEDTEIIRYFNDAKEIELNLRRSVKDSKLRSLNKQIGRASCRERV